MFVRFVWSCGTCYEIGSGTAFVAVVALALLARCLCY
jgi:hypothetical protein